VKIAIDEAAWAARTDLGLLRWAGELLFVLPGESQVIPARIVGGEIELFPERFAGHRALVSALGRSAGAAS